MSSERLDLGLFDNGFPFEIERTFQECHESIQDCIRITSWQKIIEQKRQHSLLIAFDMIDYDCDPNDYYTPDEPSVMVLQEIADLFKASDEVERIIREEFAKSKLPKIQLLNCLLNQDVTV